MNEPGSDAVVGRAPSPPAEEPTTEDAQDSRLFECTPPCPQRGVGCVMGSMTPSPCAKLTQACDGVGKRSSGITDLRQDPLRENTAVQAVPRCPVSVGGVVIPEQTHRTELRSEDNELNDYDSRKTKRGWTRGPHVAWQRDALFSLPKAQDARRFLNRHLGRPEVLCLDVGPGRVPEMA